MKGKMIVGVISMFLPVMMAADNPALTHDTSEADSLHNGVSIGLSARSDTELDLNIESAFEAGPGWSSAVSGDVYGNIRGYDFNDDSFMDEPVRLHFGISNDWTFRAGDGTWLDFGIFAMHESRKGGQEGYDRDTYTEWPSSSSAMASPWGLDVKERGIGGHLNASVPFTRPRAGRITAEARLSYRGIDSWYGASSWLAGRCAVSASAGYENEIADGHDVRAGVSAGLQRRDGRLDRTVRSADAFDPETGLFQDVCRQDDVSLLWTAGIYGGYIFTFRDKFKADVRLDGTWYGGNGVRAVPDITLDYSPAEQMTLTLGLRRSLEYADPLMDNLQVFSTGKVFKGLFLSNTLEDSWTFGGEIRYRFKLRNRRETVISLGYSHRNYTRQMVVDYEHVFNAISFYNLDGRRSYSGNIYFDIGIEPVERLHLKARFSYVDAKMELEGRGLTEKPMTQRYQGHLLARYSTLRGRWTFSLDASVNGPCRVYDFMRSHKDADGNLLYADGYTPVWPGLDMSVGKWIGPVEIYAGAENITGFRQKDVILGSRDPATGLVSPHQPSFDASAIWGPVIGTRFYVGIRYRLAAGK